MNKIVSILILMLLISISIGNVLGRSNEKTLDSDLEIVGIFGGLGLTVTIKNNGYDRTPEYPWEVSVTGGIVVIGRNLEGTIPPIDEQDTIDIFCGIIIGIGIVEFELMMDDIDFCRVSGILIGPLVLGV